MTLQWFLGNDCELAVHPAFGDPRIFAEIYKRTNGRPCDDCHCKDTCPAWPKVTHEREGTKPPVYRGFNVYPKKGRTR